MRTTWRSVGALALHAGVALAAEAPALPRALLDASADVVAARVAVPSAARKVGEVRLVTRGGATIVQTLLATKLLARVVGEIRTKEEANWPVGVPGREDMEQYLAAIERVAGELVAGRDAATETADRRLRLLIELVATPEHAGLVVGEFTGGDVGGRLEPAERRPIVTLALRKTYVFRNMRLILADAFGVPERELARLGPLGPIGDAAPGPPR